MATLLRNGHQVSRRVFHRLCTATSNVRSFANDNLPIAQPLVETDTIGHVLLVGINRPEKRNCVNQATAELLCRAFQDFEADNELRVAVLYGKGGNFCAGYDLSELSGLNSVDDLTVDVMMEKGSGPMGPSRMMFSKPVIAAVSGYAVAGGLELACMCDLRVAEESAIFGVFCRRFGVPLIDGGTVRLPQMIGLSRALDLILTGRPVSGKEAVDIGLANRLVPIGAALGEATKLAQTLAAFPQECLLRDRSSAYHSCFNASSLAEAFKFELENAKHVVGMESVSDDMEVPCDKKAMDDHRKRNLEKIVKDTARKDMKMLGRSGTIRSSLGRTEHARPATMDRLDGLRRIIAGAKQFVGGVGRKGSFD